MKTALITGASRGIGRATAEIFASNGFNLYLTCKSNIKLLSEFAAELETKYKIRVCASKTDAGSFKETEALFSRIKELDVCINNAGISYVGLINDMTEKQWQETMRSNLDSVFYSSKFAVPIMLQKHNGHIINVSSVWGNIGASMEVAYSASKGGVNSFTKALAKELAPSNISVNAIACGFVDTDMNAHLCDEDRSILMDEIPAGRFTSAEEVAKAIYNLSQMPAYLTGQIITIDGGWT